MGNRSDVVINSDKIVQRMGSGRNNLAILSFCHKKFIKQDTGYTKDGAGAGYTDYRKQEVQTTMSNPPPPPPKKKKKHSFIN